MAHYFYITPDEYEQAAKLGIDKFNLERRIRLLGWDKEKALTTPLRSLKRRGKWAKIAEKNGICYSTFMTRVNKHGWSEERAATEPLQDRRKAAIKGTEKIRKLPKKYVDLAQKNGISYHTFRARIKKGWHPLRAATEPVWSFSKAGKLGAKTMQEKYGRFHKLIFKEA